MEEILQQINKIFKDTEDVGRRLESGFEVFKIKLDSIVYGSKEPCQTPQHKKKVKRLSIIQDGDESVNSHKEIASQTNEIVIKTEISETSTTSTRSSRAAKLKAGSLKQPKLTEKPSQCDDTSSAAKAASDNTISSVSTGKSNHNSTDCKSKSSASENDKRDRNPTKRSSDEDPKSNFNNKHSLIESTKKVDESLLIVPSSEVQIFELSDNETDKLMPPPVDIPKKKATRKGKQSEAKSEPPTRSSRLRIKQEKLSIDASSLEKVKQSQSSTSETVKIEEKEIKTEQEENENTSKRGKSKRGKKPFKCMPIKEEAPKDNNENVKENSTNKGNVKESSMGSVYEDAVSENIPKETAKATSNSVSNGEVDPRNVGLSEQVPADATFVSAKDTPVSEMDATFVTNTCPQKTFVMAKDKNNEPSNTPGTADVDKTQVFSNNKAISPADTTFSINNETFKAQPSAPKDNKQENLMHNSIMTEEDSNEEIIPSPVAPTRPVAMPKSNQRKELFNSPCIPSPLKKKVEAFEKHANAIASPAALRQTRLKAKLKENKDPEPTIQKQITPLLKRDISKLLTPTQQANITPNIGIQNNKFLANSTSKLPQSQKCTGAIKKAQSLSRENSAEDVKRAGYISKLQIQAEEKKKKREQKQQQVQMTREARDKEKIERTKKLVLEREEKMRRKAQEMEMKKQLQTINKNIKHHEERLETHKTQLEQELAEAARREREMLDNMKIQRAKEELQAKLLENQRLLNERKLARKGKDALKFDFEHLNSDDSTDEEGKPNRRKPPPPIWSKSTMRNMLIERQSKVPSKIIDAFFSVQPMTPDLREIFPAIDPRYLKRNSSMYWNTPPRYSQLPKY